MGDRQVLHSIKCEVRLVYFAGKTMTRIKVFMTFPTEDPSKPCLEPGAQLRPGTRQQAQRQLQP